MATRLAPAASFVSPTPRRPPPLLLKPSGCAAPRQSLGPGPGSGCSAVLGAGPCLAASAVRKLSSQSHLAAPRGQGREQGRGLGAGLGASRAGLRLLPPHAKDRSIPRHREQLPSHKIFPWEEITPTPRGGRAEDMGWKLRSPGQGWGLAGEPLPLLLHPHGTGACAGAPRAGDGVWMRPLAHGALRPCPGWVRGV